MFKELNESMNQELQEIRRMMSYEIENIQQRDSNYISLLDTNINSGTEKYNNKSEKNH